MGRHKAERIRILKELAMAGAITGEVLLSSGDLAGRLGISQQSASGKILELVKEGMLLRRMGPRKQALQLTPRAVARLRKEHSDYMKLFESAERIAITGKVTGGFGEGGYYVGQDHYREQFRQKLGMKPFPGTLNLKLSGPEMTKFDLLREQAGIALDGFTNNGRTFGTGKCFRARIGNIECAVVVPDRSHHSDSMEIICEKQLRKALGLKDGESVKLEVML